MVGTADDDNNDEGNSNIEDGDDIKDVTDVDTCRVDCVGTSDETVQDSWTTL